MEGVMFEYLFGGVKVENDFIEGRAVLMRQSVFDVLNQGLGALKSIGTLNTNAYPTLAPIVFAQSSLSVEKGSESSVAVTGMGRVTIVAGFVVVGLLVLGLLLGLVSTFLHF
eukprot:scaffold98062_cov37-Cyclotella_meneghiniana.AAC.1